MVVSPPRTQLGATSRRKTVKNSSRTNVYRIVGQTKASGSSADTAVLVATPNIEAAIALAYKDFDFLEVVTAAFVEGPVWAAK
jgi:hypothetical protein